MYLSTSEVALIAEANIMIQEGKDASLPAESEVMLLIKPIGQVKPAQWGNTFQKICLFSTIQSPDQKKRSNGETIVSLCLAKPTLPNLDFNPLQCWKDKAQRLPALAKLSRKICALAT